MNPSTDTNSQTSSNVMTIRMLFFIPTGLRLRRSIGEIVVLALESDGTLRMVRRDGSEAFVTHVSTVTARFPSLWLEPSGLAEMLLTVAGTSYLLQPWRGPYPATPSSLVPSDLQQQLLQGSSIKQPWNKYTTVQMWHDIFIRYGATIGNAQSSNRSYALAIVGGIVLTIALVALAYYVTR